jgi:hypothetical protein
MCGSSSRNGHSVSLGAQCIQIEPASESVPTSDGFHSTANDTGYVRLRSVHTHYSSVMVDGRWTGRSPRALAHLGLRTYRVAAGSSERGGVRFA